jgi:hypothetical protein
MSSFRVKNGGFGMLCLYLGFEEFLFDFLGSFSPREPRLTKQKTPPPCVGSQDSREGKDTWVKLVATELSMSHRL